MTALLLNRAPGAPCTRKMVALLPYRRIAYRWVLSVSGVPGLPQARLSLLPPPSICRAKTARCRPSPIAASVVHPSSPPHVMSM